MVNQQESQPQLVTLKRPEHQYILLIAADGSMLGLNNAGDPALFDEADDRVIWDRTAEGLKHMATGRNIATDISNDVCTLPVGSDEVFFHICHGPEKLPSEYLEHLRREGWVCLNSILQPQIIERLERVACTGPYDTWSKTWTFPRSVRTLPSAWR